MCVCVFVCLCVCACARVCVCVCVSALARAQVAMDSQHTCMVIMRALHKALRRAGVVGIALLALLSIQTDDLMTCEKDKQASPKKRQFFLLSPIAPKVVVF